MDASPKTRKKHHGRTGRVRGRRARETTKRPVPDTSPEMIALMRFLKSRGFVNSTALQPVLYEGQGRGLRSKRCTIGKDSPILCLPLECLLLPSAIIKSNPALYSNKSLTEDEILVHFLYSQRQALDRGETPEPEWAPYIRALPQRYERWPEDPISSLDFTSVLLSGLLPREYIKVLKEEESSYKRIHSSLQSLVAPKPLDRGLFQWAFNVLVTRSLGFTFLDEEEGGEENQRRYSSLVPLFDLINHCPFANVELCVSEQQNTFRLIARERPVKRGAQILIHYDRTKTHRQFFATYGITHIPPVPEQFSSLAAAAADSFSLIPSPMDFFKFTLEELFEVPWKFKQALPAKYSQPCLKAASNRIYNRKARLMSLLQRKPLVSDGYMHLVVNWPVQLSCRNEQYVVSLKRDGSYAIFDRNSRHCLEPLPPQSTYGRYIYPHLDKLLWLLSVRHLPPEEATLDRRVDRMKHRFRTSDMNAEGPVGELPGTEERLLYLHLQLLLVEWLLWSRFTSEELPQAMSDQVDKGDPVEVLHRYRAILMWSARVMPGQLAQVLLNEMAMLLFVRKLIREKCRPLRDSLEGDERARFKCTCDL